MAKGISDAQRMKEKMLMTEDDFAHGTIKSIHSYDAENRAIAPGEDKRPEYAEVVIDFGSGIRATIPCSVEEAGEYHVGQRASIDLEVNGEDDNVSATEEEG